MEVEVLKADAETEEGSKIMERVTKAKA